MSAQEMADRVIGEALTTVRRHMEEAPIFRARAVRQAHAAGWSTRRIAEWTGLSHSTVARIVGEPKEAGS